MKNILLSVHIPKTGGTSIRRILEAVYGTGLVIDHQMGRHLEKWNPEGWDIQKPETVIGALCGIECIHGHFEARKFAGLCTVPGLNPCYATWLRDPVERTASAYHFLRSFPLPKNPELVSEWQKTALENDFPAFLKLSDHWKERQSRQLEGFDLDRFSFVGITDEFSLCLPKFLDLLRGLGKQVPDDLEIAHERKNTGKKEAGYEIDPAVRKIIERGCKKDMDLYRRAMERLHG